MVEELRNLYKILPDGQEEKVRMFELSKGDIFRSESKINEDAPDMNEFFNVKLKAMSDPFQRDSDGRWGIEIVKLDREAENNE